jgi:hypothetical protein
VVDTDVDRPAPSTRADVALVARGITVTAAVDGCEEAGPVVRPVGPATAWRASVRPGDRVDVYWVSGYDERTLPTTVTSVEGTAEPTWWLRQTGCPARSRRRKSVRGRVELPVVLSWSGGLLRGTSVDLSEGGARLLLDGGGAAPDPGETVAVSLTLEEGIGLDLSAEVVWQDVGGPKWLLALSFVGVTDADRETLRRRVFRALREELALIGG